MSPFLLFPDFAIIALGYLLRRFWLPAASWAVIERLVYFVLFPCLLFYSVVNSPLSAHNLGAFAAGTPLIVVACFALGWMGKGLSSLSKVDFASGLQVCYRFNSYIALALASRLGGEQAVAQMAILLAVGVPLCNVLAVGSMSSKKPWRALGDMAKNPLIVGTLGGVVFKLSGLTMPEPVMLTLGRLAPAAVALGLMAVGSGLVFSGLKGHVGVSSWFLAVKLLISPLIAVVYAKWFGLGAQQTDVLLMYAALPTASSAYILATRMGGNGPFVACLISLSTVLAAFTIPMVFELTQRLGF